MRNCEAEFARISQTRRRSLQHFGHGGLFTGIEFPWAARKACPVLRSDFGEPLSSTGGHRFEGEVETSESETSSTSRKSRSRSYDDGQFEAGGA
jgi:hypothetical protein